MDTVRMSSLMQSLRDFRQKLDFIQTRDRYRGQQLQTVDLDAYSTWAQAFEDELDSIMLQAKMIVYSPMRGHYRW